MRGSGTIIKKCKCKNQARCIHGWTFRWWDKGQHEETFSTKKLAEDRQAQVWRDKRAGEETFKLREVVEFLAYLEGWISGPRRDNTRAGYLVALKKIRPELEGRTLVQVAEDREAAQKLLDGLPESYRARVRTIVVGACNEAVKAGKIDSHRLAGLRIEASSDVAEFEYAERERLEAFAAALGTLGLIVWLGRLCGLRIGESLGVNISDFREDGTVLRLSRQRLSNGKLGPLKSRKPGDFRDVPVPAALWTMVQAATTDEGGYLFREIWSAQVYKKVRSARDSAGLPGKFTCHWLRHMWASDLLGNGVPITDVSRWLGHRSIELTYRTYSHFIPVSFDRARGILDSQW